MERMNSGSLTTDSIKPVFFNVCDGPMILCRIHPLQQRNVARLIEAAASLPSVNRILIFGSSVTRYCTLTSDLDYAVDWKFFDGLEQNALRMSIPNVTVDMIDFTGDSNDKLQKEIMSKGVLVYDANSDTINNPATILSDVMGGVTID